MEADTDFNFMRASLTDAAVLADMRIRFLTELDLHAVGVATDRLRAALLAYFQRSLSDGSFVAWLARSAEHAVATAGMVIWRIPARHVEAPTGDQGYILNCYTVEEFRRRGLMARLMRMLIADATERGISHVQLHATPDGIGLYRRLGFLEPRYPVLELDL